MNLISVSNSGDITETQDNTLFDGSVLQGELFLRRDDRLEEGSKLGIPLYLPYTASEDNSEIDLYIKA